MCSKIYNSNVKNIGPGARSSHQCCVYKNKSDETEYYLFGGGWTS